MRRSKMEISKSSSSLIVDNNGTTTAAAEAGTISLKMKKSVARKRKVRFSATMSQVVCIIDHREDLSFEEKENLYMSPENVQQIREDAKFVTKYFRSRNKEVIAEIDESYCAALNLATKNYATADDFTQFLRDDDNAVLQNAASPLYNWCVKTKVSGRGLERYCSAKQRAERGAFAAECRQAVLRLCANAGVDPEDVGQFYSEYARSCALFSRLMGLQDQEAAQEAYRQMARKERAMAKTSTTRRSSYSSSSRPMVMEDIVVVQPATPANSDQQDIVLPPLEGAASDNAHSTKSSSLDRRTLLIKSQSTSARILVERLSERVGSSSNRCLADTVQI